MLFTILGVASALIFIAGDIPYLVDTIKAKIKPHRVTWGVVALLNAIGFANQRASGASNSLWLFGTATIITATIFLASLRNGTGGHTNQDIIAVVACLTGLVLWAVFNSPIFSIFANVFVATVALIPSFVKAKRAPESETGIAWLAGSFSALLAAISVGKFDWQLLLIPVSSMLLQAYMVYILYFWAKKQLKP